MRQKLYRGRRNVFRKRNPALRIIGTLLIAVVVVAAGFFGAKWFSEHPITQPSGSEQPTVSAPVTEPDTSAPSTDTTPDTSDTPSAPVSTDTVRGIYLPLSKVTDTALLTAAKEAGFNAVFFDLKDAEGRLYYRFASSAAVQVNSFTESALTADQLSALFSAVREAGLLPIPRLYAFQDNLGAKALANARISHKDNSGWVWYDGKPANGAKAWLNPYANAAHNYIIGLATELKTAGAAAVMLDGVQFPKQTSSSNFGTENRDLKQDEVLSLFVKRAREALGAECPVLLTCTAESALGTATQVYGGNPLTFGPTMVSPVLSYSADMQDVVHKMILRTQVLEEKPVLTPLLSTDTLTAAQVNEMITSIVSGGTNSFILYAADGQYDFSAYDLP